MFERPSTFSRFAVAYSCSFVRFEPPDPPDLALLVVREAVLLARELPLRAVVLARELAVLAAFRVPLAAFRAPLVAFRVPLAAFRVPLPAAFRVPPAAFVVPLLAAFFARELPVLAAFRVPLAALRVVPVAAFRVLLAAFRVLPAAFRVAPEALAVPLLAVLARAVPLLDDLRVVAFGADLLEPFEAARARLPEERPPRAEVRVSPELREPSPPPWSLCSSPWPMSFLATLTAAGTATPSAAPATTFFVVDIPSSSGSISHTSHLSGSCLTCLAPR